MQVANPWGKACAVLVPITVQRVADNRCLSESFLCTGIMLVAEASGHIEANTDAASRALAAAMSPVVAAMRSACDPRSADGRGPLSTCDRRIWERSIAGTVEYCAG
jgi:hypothetical protein